MSFHETMADEWEHSKENVQPLKQGRKISSLRAALTPSTDYHEKLLRDREEFETAIRTAVEDPLSVWFKYLMWTEENFPKGSKDIGHLLERCIAQFRDEPAYRNDPRYLTLWTKYADLSEDPGLVFDFLHDNKIGDELAMFYECWAVYLEDAGNVKKADEVLNLGIARSAQPLEKLKKRHREFEIRLLHHVGECSDEEAPNTEEEETRNPLAGLKSRGRRGKVGALRTGAAIKKGSQGIQDVSGVSRNNKSVTIFCDSENAVQPRGSIPEPSGEWQAPPIHSEVTRENVQKPGKWNKAKLDRHHAVPEPAKPVFSIHVDEGPGIAGPDTPQPKPDPFSTQLVLSTRKSSNMGGSFLTRMTERCNPQARQFQENGKEYKVMYCKEHVYPSRDISELHICYKPSFRGELEYQLEEIRARKEKYHFVPISLEEHRRNLREHPTVSHDEVPVQGIQEKPLYDRNKLYTFEEELQPEQLKARHPRYHYIPPSLQEQRQALLQKMNNRLHDNSVQSNSRLSESLLSRTVHCQPTEVMQSRAEASFNVRTDCSYQEYNSLQRTEECLSQLQVQENTRPVEHSHRRSALQPRDLENEFVPYHEDIQQSVKEENLSPRGQENDEPAFSVAQPIASQPFIYEDPVPQPCKRSLVYSDENKPVQEQTQVQTEIHQDSENLPPKEESSTSRAQQFALAETPPRQQFITAKPRRKIDSMNSSKWTAPSPTITMHTKEAISDIMAMFHKPISPMCKMDSDEEDFEADYLDHTREGPPINSFVTDPPKMPKLTIFTDEPQDYKDSLPSENQENMPPLGHTQPRQVEKRPLNGILQPSVGIAVCPIPEEEDGEEVATVSHQDPEPKFSNQTLSKMGSLFSEDTTVSDFHSMAQMASTPFQGGFSSKRPFISNLSGIQLSSTVVSEADQPVEPFTAVVQHGFETPSKATQLSPIEEVSDEGAGLSTTKCSVVSQGSFEQLKNGFKTIHEEAEPENDLTGFMKLGPGITIEDTIICYSHEGQLKANPFAEDIVKRMLSKIKPSITHWDQCHYDPDNDLPHIAVKKAISLGNNVFNIDCVLGSGGFAKVYKCSKLSAEFCTDELEVIVALKVQNTLTYPLWEFYICSQLGERLQKTGKYSSMNQAVMTADQLFVFNNAGAIVTEYHPNGSFLELINLYKTKDKELSEGLAAYYTCELLSIVEAVHECGIIHGDIKPDNFMLRDVTESLDPLSQRRLTLIDFGRSIDLTLFPKGTTFKANCYTDSFQCVEMKEERPWTFQLDLYGIAGTIHCLLFGEYMKVYKTMGKYKPMKTVPRFWKKNLWNEFFDLLLNVPSCSEMPSLPKLRERFQDIVNTKKSSVLDALRNEDIMLFG